MLQQCLPFTVLKLEFRLCSYARTRVATMLTVHGIETNLLGHMVYIKQFLRCNNAYRSRY